MVVNKVISVGILAGITLSDNFITSLFKSSDFISEFINFWTFSVKIWQAALAIFMVLYCIGLLLQ